MTPEEQQRIDDAAEWCLQCLYDPAREDGFCSDACAEEYAADFARERGQERGA